MADEKLKYDMTLQQLLTNPTGPYSAYFFRRDRIILDLKERYYKLMDKNKGLLKTMVYKNGKDYIFHLKVPSETVKDLIYDVIIKFYPDSKDSATESSLLNYKIKMFSNAPNFTFTYTHVMNRLGLLAEEFVSKCNNRALTEEPKVRNPIGTLGFEKSCYFAALYIKEKLLYKKAVADRSALKFAKAVVLPTVKSDEQKMSEYNILKNREKAEKAAAKSKKVAETNKKNIERNNAARAKTQQRREAEAKRRAAKAPKSPFEGENFLGQ